MATIDAKDVKRSAAPATTPMIRGSVIVEAKRTIEESYGARVHRAALDALAPEERSVIEATQLASSFYPVEAWDHYLQNVVIEVGKRTGETSEQFFSRLVQLGGGRLVQMLYKVFLRAVSPTSVVKLIPGFWIRLYTSGDLQILENEPGRCVMLFTDSSSAYRYNFVSHLPPSMSLLLGLAGARNVVTTLVRDEIRHGELQVELATTYDDR